jgi:hypothetical protein
MPTIIPPLLAIGKRGWVVADYRYGNFCLAYLGARKTDSSGSSRQGRLVDADEYPFRNAPPEHLE